MPAKKSAKPQAEPKTLRTRGLRPAPPGWERVADFAKRNHFGINQVYAACKRGELEHIRVGRTLLVRPDALERRAAALAGNNP